MIGAGRSYEDLLTQTVEMKIDDQLRVRVLDLKTLIQTKEEIAAEKDAAVLPILRQTLKEKSRHRQ
jgi:hypothetical protein